jgi:hypothetical protein
VNEATSNQQPATAFPPSKPQRQPGAARDDAVRTPRLAKPLAIAASSRAQLQQPATKVQHIERPRSAHAPPAMADQRIYHPRDALANTTSTMLQTTAVGAVIAGVQNTLRKQNVGAMGILTRSGGIIALYGP